MSYCIKPHNAMIAYIYEIVHSKQHWIRHIMNVPNHMDYTENLNKIFFPVCYVILGILVFVTFEIIPLNAKFVIRNQPNR